MREGEPWGIEGGQAGGFSQRKAQFNRELHRWYRSNGRHDLPWRLTRDPYAILVSEVMLQQTQVDRVVPYYHRFLERWPDVNALAAASQAEVIREWAGLGYNRRALNLCLAAKAIVERYGGIFPRDEHVLRALPGAGPYTAAAVASFAFERPVAVVDTNVARVLARSRAGFASRRSLTPSVLRGIAADSLSSRDGRAHNLALMDLGALVCKARDPSCEACPVVRHCAWYGAGSPPEPKAPQPATVPRFETTARFARGRIIDALRAHSPLAEAMLAESLPEEHRGRLRMYLEGLSRDGLVVATAGGWSLPG